MARNKLTKDAIKIADLIRQKSVERTDKEVAEAIGIDPSTLCRFKAEHLDKFCAFLDELGLTVVDVEQNTEIHRALFTFAKLGFESLEQ